MFPVAIAIVVCSVLWFFFGLLVIAFLYSQLIAPDTNSDERQTLTMYMLFLLISMAYTLMLTTGAVSMVRRGSYTWAFACSCLAMVPFFGPFYFLGIPLGIWAIIVLRRPQVRDSFGKR